MKRSTFCIYVKRIQNSESWIIKQIGRALLSDYNKVAHFRDEQIGWNRGLSPSLCLIKKT